MVFVHVNKERCGQKYLAIRNVHVHINKNCFHFSSIGDETSYTLNKIPTKMHPQPMIIWELTIHDIFVYEYIGGFPLTKRETLYVT